MEMGEEGINPSTHVWLGVCHRAGTREGHKLVTSFVDHKTADWKREQKE